MVAYQNIRETKYVIGLFFYLLVLSMLFNSCAVQRSARKDAPTVVYPPPPDTARLQFLTSFNNTEFVTGAQSGFNRIVFGKEDPLPITKPMGIKIKKGKIKIKSLFQ